MWLINSTFHASAILTVLLIVFFEQKAYPYLTVASLDIPPTSVADTRKYSFA